MPPTPPIALAVLLGLAAPTVALAADGLAIPIRVEFDAPAGCSSSDTFYGGLLARMSRARRAMPGEDAVRLSVRLTRAGSRIRGELRLKDGGPGEGDTRRVEGETCDSVVEVLSLTAALALVTRPTPPIPQPPPRPPSRSSSSQSTSTSSPTAQSSPDKTAKPPEPEPPPPEKKQDEPAAVAIVEPPKPPAPARGAHFDLGLQAVAADVISSGISVGGGLTLRYERDPAERRGASVGLTFLYASNDLLQDADALAVNWMAVAATACPGLSLGGSIRLQPCAQVMGGWLSATGRGITMPNSAGRTWWSVGALARADLRLGARFLLELDAGATIPLAKRTFVFTTPEGTVGETPTVAPVVTLGLSRSL